jgi:8-oxo-dGTP pyrophosphatase MutT (NUDIX family)
MKGCHGPTTSNRPFPDMLDKDWAIDSRALALAEELQGAVASLGQRARSTEAARMIELARTPGRVLDRTHFLPGHFTASAFVLTPDLSCMLLILHKKLKLWLQPGGHIEVDDPSWHFAARREVQEETGLLRLQMVDELIDIDIHQIPSIASEPAHLHFDLRAFFIASNTEVNPGEGVSQARWFTLEEILSQSGGILADEVGSDESVARVARATLLLKVGRV